LPAVKALSPLSKRGIPHPTGLLWWSATIALAIGLLFPIFAAGIPPLLDYPNHLARMDILAHGADEPALARMYRIDWHIVPNIGIDLIMPPLLHVLPLLTAGKIFLALAVLLPYFGIILLHKSLFRVPSYWPLCGALIVYNRLFFLGFLNFEIGVGLALIAAATRFLRGCFRAGGSLGTLR
jgi:hypothetical protein